MSKWWKCDLQVGTPAWRFTIPTGLPTNFEDSAARQQFSDAYMESLKKQGITVIALAAHNSHEWIDDLKAAGDRHQVTVFPGCEITSASGSDGVHLLIVGDTSLTEKDFDRLLSSELGYDNKNPRYLPGFDGREPAASGKTVTQLLDELPTNCLAIGAHALNDNGIASSKTQKGDLRWRALHHERLSAIDVGSDNTEGKDGFNKKFRSRSLPDFPCLKYLAFVETSDAYGFEDFGKRFTWIRMDYPSIEALRQAFLDPESRIICSTDPRLQAYPDGDPNNIRHGWIETVSLDGQLGNSKTAFSLSFHPGLNVLIGARGSGKSTVVAAIRELFGSNQSLPERINDDACAFSEAVFPSAELSSYFRLVGSQVRNQTMWKGGQRNVIDASGGSVPMSFNVRVVSQKELFERVSHNRADPLSASRNFLALVDESLNLQNSSEVGSWWTRFEQSRLQWIEANQAYKSIQRERSQLPAVQSRISELRKQIAAFESEEAKARLSAAQLRELQSKTLADNEKLLSELIRSLATANKSVHLSGEGKERDAEFDELLNQLNQIAITLHAQITQAIANAQSAVETFQSTKAQSTWSNEVLQASIDLKKYTEELSAKGIDPASYEQLRQELSKQRENESALLQAAEKEAQALTRLNTAKAELNTVLMDRRDKRRQLLEDVQSKSQRLQFEVIPRSDRTGWAIAVRNLLNLQAGWFVDDITDLANWLGGSDQLAERERRWRVWRDALLSGNFETLTSQVKLRKEWLQKLEKLDEVIRMRLSAEFVDDIITIKFLREHGNPSEPIDWQNISEGSPGQRTAAMLGFVLHHGTEPLVLDQPEDDLDTELISDLVVKELRASRWKRQIIVVTHNANIPVNGDAEKVIVMENDDGSLRVRQHETVSHQVEKHEGPIEVKTVRRDIQKIMEGGVTAFMLREKKYNNELRLLAAVNDVAEMLDSRSG